MKKNRFLIIAILNDVYMDGNLIDFIDIYFNIKNYLPTDFFILANPSQIPIFYYKLKKTFKEKVLRELISCIRPINYDVDISSYKALISSYNFYRMNKKILDNCIIIVHWNFVKNIVVNNIDISNYKIISTSFIYQFLDKTKYKNIYLCPMKLSEYRLDNMIISYKKKIFNNYNNYESMKSIKDFNIHDYCQLDYFRHIRDINDTNNTIVKNIEIKGKLIFEFLYFNKSVHYSPINKVVNDGLTDYLELFNINDNVEQDFHISREEIFDKLVKFDKTDTLLDIITN